MSWDKVVMEFHISRKVRDRYEFDDSLFSMTGNVFFADLHAVRLFTHKMNEKRNVINFPEEALSASEMYAMGLIDEILHYVAGLYRKERVQDVLKSAIDYLYKKNGKEPVEKLLYRFVEEFPSVSVYRGKTEPKSFLNGATEGVGNREIVLEEIIMLRLANMNKAFSPFSELFNDIEIGNDTDYLNIFADLHDFFDTQPFFGPDNQNIIDMLRSPAIEVPYSLSGQLEYIRRRWGFMLDKHLYRLLSALDLIREEEHFREHGPGPSYVYEFKGMETETENFSPDSNWMPKVVLLAKNIYVWLNQLSKKYNRSMKLLNDIPDEELDILARWGFSGLWLIGLWERSQASKKIKQLCGNPEAEASAYSLHDYTIASDLGGRDAFEELKQRAWKRGIRLASDMVPNHVGIDSRWVTEHPDWFISSENSPFPSYNFNGQDLSQDERVGVYIEDGYYNRSDAAVVFKRLDHYTGDVKYIYHGNDGTHMPWNDTAQLNYLNPEVREAVIQTILHVARRFPIIRFDAAMTLAKKHYQRLWFPEPGTGGAIPSRAEHGMSKKDFDNLMPKEFWREVVDRVAKEVPDTLLLAEAFWLMEGYFVRTLGMHRVYNSAFMNMLKNEENANYRSVMKNTLEFDPEILKRFVNFMNNPDEETAVAQFGKGDKYFGICTLMATMPGLPMFGHGQIEGLSERYGMEYRRAYYDEEPDDFFIHRHEEEIFPLLHRRHIFSDVKNFLLYDFFTPDGYVNEDVFAFSNSCGEEKALIVYHNKYANVKGWIRTSVGYLVKSDTGNKLVQKNLGEGLGLSNSNECFCIFRDYSNGLEYIRSSEEMFDKGLYVDLGAYKCHVFLDFYEVHDNKLHQYRLLTDYLNGRGVPSIDKALKEVFLQPVHYAFKELVNRDILNLIMFTETRDLKRSLDKDILGRIEDKTLLLADRIKQFAGFTGDALGVANGINAKLETILNLSDTMDRLDLKNVEKHNEIIKYMQKGKVDDLPMWGSVMGWLFIHLLGKIAGDTEFHERSRSWIDEWHLNRILADIFVDSGINKTQAWRCVDIIKILTAHQLWFEAASAGDMGAYHILSSWLKDNEIQKFLQINRYKDVLWFNHESFEEILWWMFFIAVISILSDNIKTSLEKREHILCCFGLIERLVKAEKVSEYRVEKLIDKLKEEQDKFDAATV